MNLIGLKFQMMTRKNQRQVDVTGRQLDLNRPDVQYNLTKDGIKHHHNEEFDRDPIRTLAHEKRIRDNDPAAVTILYLLINN